MKKIILLIVMLLLAGCAKGQTDVPAVPVPVIEEDPSERYLGTWRSSYVTAEGEKLDMDELESIGAKEYIDMILVLAQDGNGFIYLSYESFSGSGAWTFDEDKGSIFFLEQELHAEDDELILASDDMQLHLQKISDRQDEAIIDEILAAEKDEKDKIEEPIQEESEPQEPEKRPENEIRPEVKEAIDAYEAFVDEYIAFMEKYSESEGTDLTLLADYGKFMADLADYSAKMEGLEDDLNEAEYLYYLEVMNRCNEKLIKAAY